MSINNWFVFPIHVFIDTQIYINESYNFNEKGKLDFFSKQVLDNKVVHLTSEIVIKELEKHIRKDIAEATEHYNKLKNGRNFAIFRGRASNLFQNIDNSKIIEEAISIFHEYLSDTKAFKLSIDTIDLNSVVSDYFEANPPFGMKKDKKSEFPDAFNLAMIRKYADHNPPVIIVSGDGDFLEEKNIGCFKTLGELLDAINSQDEITQKVKEYLKTQQQDIFDKIESELMNIGFEIEVDGRDVGRKGDWYGFEYEESELLSVVPIDYHNLDVIGVDYEDGIITVDLECKAKLEFNCSFFDEENSIWDPEDKEYSSTYYGTINEIHRIGVPTTIIIAFDNKDENIMFDIEDIEVDTNIKLDQYTLQKESRKRIDNPHSYWEEDAETVINPCPDCGCEMTFENEGGNGFCINCAPNH